MVFDRRDFSSTLLTVLHQRNIHPVFRIPKSSVTAFNSFRKGDQDDVQLNFMPPKDALRNRHANSITPPKHPIPLRLVHYTIKDSCFVLATTVIDPQAYPLNALADLYHGRWSIEELYKTLKHTTTLEHVHSKSERGVRQELYAHFTLVAMTWLFTNQGDLSPDEPVTDTTPHTQTNVTNALAVMARNLKEVILTQAHTLATTLSRVLNAILRVQTTVRPHRSCERRSRKTANTWKHSQSTT